MDRRDFVKMSSLIAAGSLVPEFVARSAELAKPGKDNVLVVIEMTGGNDGINTVIPFADDLYYKARPTIGIPKKQVLKIDDEVGLHPRLEGLNELLQQGELAVVQGVGYPNPTRSHFDSMDIWQSADPRRKHKTGWLARTLPSISTPNAGFPGMQIAPGKLPMAFEGPSASVVSLGNPKSFQLEFGGKRDQARRGLIESLNVGTSGRDDLTAFLRRRQLETMRSVELIREVLGRKEKNKAKAPPAPPIVPTVAAPALAPELDIALPKSLGQQLDVIGRFIRKGIGTRIYYARIDGFDTHSGQAQSHANLLGEIGRGLQNLFATLRESGDADRVLALTFSEFGRRVKENASRGTDHGSASCLFVAGGRVNAGPVGKHPPLDKLADGDITFGIDFRRVYATILDRWLECDSTLVLGDKFEHLPLLKKRS